MKTNIKYIIAITLLVSSFLGCKKLDQVPLDKLSLSTTFVNEFGFQSYAWQFYNAFSAYGNYGNGQGNDAGTSPYSIGNDANSDVLAVSSNNSQTNWIAQRKLVPTGDGFYTDSYARLRAINVMLDNIDSSPLSDEAKTHWRAVCYFFRAYNYANLINLYGDVPYVEKLLTDTDPELFIPRTPRDEIAAKILEDLNYAVNNLRAKESGAYVKGSNAISPDAALAFISRFGLREGTWRKYHKEESPSPLATSANVFLQASVEASQKLITKYPTLGDNYDLDFNSDNLDGRAGIIMFKAYGGNGTLNVGHDFTSNQMNRFGYLDLTKAAVDQYLLKDGQTRYTSPLFKGDKNAYDEFRNRDERLYYTVPPPYRVILSGGQMSTNYTYTNDPRDTSYFGFMRGISDDSHKTLPVTTGGLPGNAVIIGIEPNFFDINLDAQATNLQNTFSGYRLYKYANNVGASGIAKWSDAPIFRLGEILVNHAEATYELGQFNQAIADQTINKTRARGKVAALNVNSIPNDPTRDTGVSPVLWEIRRERNIELMAEGFRFDDLRRWKKMEYATKVKLGRYIIKGKDHIPAGAKVPVQGGGNEGYVSYEPTPPANWPEYYYLYPIPSDEIALNNKIIQNPGWPKN
ncbi:RagB/SusD family nutrient uptake outer membrane protein [Sphingobacterium bovistauri]|uniref:RagB/SusD family nutrient uptake outer membrane protein n=1 Tax=Sphingobacterium bovistauri TaxID=2781959 RepID=A0ABS7Z3A3_9SPHI|nr:RagB/SusD family nutrient uptake outer membrane protein [Sphingobacterium bovistauri]MCA5004658.1 RagB/SusD family nutrient uptake outer membrane protein [Sphingobacterium bovistauri]